MKAISSQWAHHSLAKSFATATAAWRPSSSRVCVLWDVWRTYWIYWFCGSCARYLDNLIFGGWDYHCNKIKLDPVGLWLLYIYNDNIMFEFDWKSANPSFQQVDTGHHDANRFFVDKCVYRLNPSTCGILSRNLNMYDHVLYVYRHINIDTIYSNILYIYICDLRSTYKLV